MSHVLIIGEGEIECPFCDPTGKKGTLKDGVSIEQARAQMQLAGEAFRRANPKWMNKDEG